MWVGADDVLSLQRIRRELADIKTQLKTLTDKVGAIMATQDELNAALDNIVASETALKDAVTNVGNKLNDLAKQIKDLQDQLSAGSTVSQETMDKVSSIATGVEEAKAQLVQDLS